MSGVTREMGITTLPFRGVSLRKDAYDSLVDQTSPKARAGQGTLPQVNTEQVMMVNVARMALCSCLAWFHVHCPSSLPCPGRRRLPQNLERSIE